MNCVRALWIVLASVCGAGGYAALITDNLAGYWPFDETTGNVAHEASGYGQDGSLINFPVSAGPDVWVAGKIGGALQFAGPSARQYVLVPDFTKPTTSLSLSAWIWADSITQWGTIAACWHDTYAYGPLFWGFFGSDPFLCLYFAQSSSPGSVSVVHGSESPQTFPPLPGGGVPPLSLGEWHHVAVVADGQTRQVQLWRDGQRAGSFRYNGGFHPAPVPELRIGGRGTGPDQGFWDGKIDDLALWTRALSTEEVLAIYQAGLNGQPLIALVPEPSVLGLAGVGSLILLARGLAFRHRR